VRGQRLAAGALLLACATWAPRAPTQNPVPGGTGATPAPATPPEQPPRQNEPQGQGQPQGQQPQGQQPGQPPGPPLIPLGPPAPAGQGPGQGDAVLDERVQQLQGKTIRSIRVLLADPKKGWQPMGADEADAIVRRMALRTGQKLEARFARLDSEDLWHERRLAVRIYGQLQDDKVDLYVVVSKEVQIYERVEFQGLKHLQRDEVDALLGLGPDRQVTSVEAQAMRNVLLARYQRDGYAFCSVKIEDREPEPAMTAGDKTLKTAVFRIDEGPRVSVRSVHFRGNVSFPGEAALGFIGAGDYLAVDAHIKSDSGGFLSSAGAYSREIVEEDLDRLKLFYRSRGFLDADVLLADAQFTPDRTQVDLVFLVVEGKRYTIRSVRVVHVDEQGKELDESKAAYKVDEVVRELHLKVGDYYDHDRILRDRLAIEEFYGKRGHPASTFPGMERVPTAFRLGSWPKERYTADAQVDLTFEIYEGTPKTLREVLIRGNQFTRDKVIRRRVFAQPGERIDMTKVKRSLAVLDQTRFFQDPVTLAGPRFELLPVDNAPDDLRLAIDVKDGETGEFRWGVGITTGAGAQATLQFNKRNFDLYSPPSTIEPIGMFEDILGMRAFHGGGQNLNLLAAPGTEISQFAVDYIEPDLLDQYFDTLELHVGGRRQVRHWRDGYTTDTLGLDVGLARRFTEELSAGLSFREESVDVTVTSPDATSIVFAAEGQTELRGVRARLSFTDVDDIKRPNKGAMLESSYEVLGGPFGAEANLWKARVATHLFTPIGQNEVGHKTVLRWDNTFGVAQAFDNSRDVFLTERFYLGGQNLRGFEPRGVGPSQFDRPLGGEAIYASTLELSYPLVSTRLEHNIRDREVLRGVVFVDGGLLGLSITDPTFRELRLSYGVGIRIDVPVLDIPIAIDFGWPIRFEETDHRQQLFFTLAR
jgi:outer membrane protein insertion porin family